MKKIIFTLLGFLMAVTVTSCSEENGGDDVIWDIAPLQANIYVLNANGDNLLDENVKDNILGHTATLVIDGKATDYLLDLSLYRGETRANLPYYWGVSVHCMVNEKNEEEFYLVLGQWDGEKSAEYEMDLIIDGHSHHVRLTNELKWKKSGPDIKRNYYLDGKKVNNKMIIYM